MKLLIASDIHGDLDSAKTLFEIFEKEGADKLLLLGDLLYHGPRNDLPRTYAPKEVIELLNANRDVLISVRGNCDTEVDQMVLSFPILADYTYVFADGITVFATHGHHYNTENPPALRRGEILLHGHTHVPACTEFGDGNLYLNPGSIALPKENGEPSYMIYENGVFTARTVSGKVLFAKNVEK